MSGIAAFFDGMRWNVDWGESERLALKRVKSGTCDGKVDSFLIFGF